MVSAWEGISNDLIKDSFKSCGITTEIDGSEDDRVVCLRAPEFANARDMLRRPIDEVQFDFVENDEEFEQGENVNDGQSFDRHSPLEPLHMDNDAIDENQEAQHDYDYTASANPNTTAVSEARTSPMPHSDSASASVTARTGFSVNANVSASSTARPGPSVNATAFASSSATSWRGPTVNATASASASASARPGPSVNATSCASASASARPGPSVNATSCASATATARPGPSVNANASARASATARPVPNLNETASASESTKVLASSYPKFSTNTNVKTCAHTYSNVNPCAVYSFNYGDEEEQLDRDVVLDDLELFGEMEL